MVCLFFNTCQRRATQSIQVQVHAKLDGLQNDFLQVRNLIEFNRLFHLLLYLVVFDNVVSKYRDRRLNESVLAVGMDALADPAAKSNMRSPFESNVVCDFERMVSTVAMIIHSFSQLFF